MSAKKSGKLREVYQIKVTLLGTEPPIWRRLLVPADMTLVDLDHVVQAAMGWDGDHLHEFVIGQQRFGTPTPSGQFLAQIRGTRGVVSEEGVRLSSVLRFAGSKAEYTYDFGDNWEHAIRFEKALPREPRKLYPVCIGGELHGPPEDCGGVPGYYNLLDAIRDPEHEGHGEMLEWVGEEFDPEAFSVDEVNARLSYLQQRWNKPQWA
ncbi:MAG TPA: plasmid pRiA4b ORF-3 family protein [Candidatus Acidoferrales bacterium]|jgi:hypothetical protein|nr:plasmid pRiA4b ORF-3 family protein [Candidatus Acidoferrales bacterium]